MSRFTRWIRSFFPHKQSQGDDVDRLLDAMSDKWTSHEFKFEPVIPVKRRPRRKSKVKALAANRRKKSKSKSVSRRRAPV